MIAHRRGHNFQSVGARHFIKEEVESEKINNYISEYLDILKVNHIDVSSPNTNSSNDLKFGVDKANKNKSTLFFSVHFNSSSSPTDSPIGTEIWTYNNKVQESKRILDNLEKLGFKNRGTKTNEKFYELRNTNCKAMIIEVCFVNSKKDVEIYNKHGAKGIAKAIVEGITGLSVPHETNKLYRVITNTYSNKSHAIQEVDKLKKQGYTTSFIMEV